MAISFAPSSIFRAPLRLRQDLSDRYTIPSCFWTDVSGSSSGFFGCHDSYDEEGKVEGYSTYWALCRDLHSVPEIYFPYRKCLDTWFRFLVKRPTHGVATGASYEWCVMQFVTKWLPPNRNVAICLDSP